MTRTPTGVPIRPGWAIPPDLDPSEAHLPRRRWRILHSAKPRTDPAGPLPNWVKTPEDFVRWLATQLDVNELHTYFRDLEAIAKMSCDLELLRFARKYLHGDVSRALTED
jgi:hypothetical protein